MAEKLASKVGTATAKSDGGNMKAFKKWLPVLKPAPRHPVASQTDRDNRLLVASGAAPAEVIRQASAPAAGTAHLLDNLATINAELSGFGPSWHPCFKTRK